MLINTNASSFKIVRGVTAAVAGIGAAALAKDAITKLGYIPTKRYQIVTAAVATFAIGTIVSQMVNQGTKTTINEYADAINQIGDVVKGNVKVEDVL